MLSNQDKEKENRTYVSWNLKIESNLIWNRCIWTGKVTEWVWWYKVEIVWSGNGELENLWRECLVSRKAVGRNRRVRRFLSLPFILVAVIETIESFRSSKHLTWSYVSMENIPSSACKIRKTPYYRVFYKPLYNFHEVKITENTPPCLWLIPSLLMRTRIWQVLAQRSCISRVDIVVVKGSSIHTLQMSTCRKQCISHLSIYQVRLPTSQSPWSSYLPHSSFSVPRKLSLLLWQ